jgi:uncharacterized membrane protein YfcA
MFELILIGIIAGLLSGLFGIGGGAVIVTMLLYLGFDIKDAIGISVVQMLFSSFFGTMMNIKNGFFYFRQYYGVAIGSGVGAVIGYFIFIYFPSSFFEILLLCVVAFSIYKLISFKIRPRDNKQHKINQPYLIASSMIISTITLPIGIGGSIIFTPILANRFGTNLKVASSIGLMLVLCSSSVGIISLGVDGYINFNNGVMAGVFSIVGVYFGLKIKKKINDVKFEYYTIILYFIMLVMIFKKVVL